MQLERCRIVNLRELNTLDFEPDATVDDGMEVEMDSLLVVAAFEQSLAVSDRDSKEQNQLTCEHGFRTKSLSTPNSSSRGYSWGHY